MKSRNVFISYLKERKIYFLEDFTEGIPRITMSFEGFLNSPSKRIEACIYFYEDSTLEIRVYYAEPGPQIVRKSENLSEIYRLINYVNARVVTRNMDGAGNTLYRPSYLLQPRIYITEDGCYDITATIVMEEDFFELAPLEIEDFVTIGVPSLLEELAPYFFGVLLGSMTSELAIQYINKNLLR
jgi:hypothetical protein